KRYMQNYPFTCIEQKVSRAIALEDDDLWGKAMNELPNYIGSDGLLRFFPGNSCTQPGLTSYVLSIANEAGYEIPEDSKSKLLDGLQSFLKGQTQICSFLQGSGSLEKIAALHTLSRYNRAEADTAFAIDQDITLWPTSTLIEWYGLLRRLPEDSRRNEKLTHAKNTILSRLNFQGSVAGFSGGLEDLWWLMSSSDLSVLRLVAEALEGNDFDTDLPRIVRSAIERQKKGHWDLTIANAWGVLAVRKFAERFERERVSGETIATIAEESRSYDWDAPSDLLLNWPLTPSPLQVIHKGSGAPWLTVQSVAAIALKESKRAGYSISRKITPVETKTAGKFSLGDVLRVSLEVTSDADRSWVVISDPIPAGASILGAGLARESQLLRRGEEQQDYWDRPTFEERSFEWFRAYFEYLPKGTRQIDFTMRLNSSGLFNLPNSRVEAMYSPEMFGEMPNLPIEVLK
ncbi:MAG: alpha-2-macroglobulin, partial [Proteobacteria bacterium]